ncbi:hypothetical protein COLO4_09473 [Corchorus olitorius]|uniref:Uncharacterized protein n=1 Tax=Corchorus olitorius TaxID=93759 RepID=A0A1R3KC27_9ROSI|nr:hypothetical protein COLO4_09473 [Corchorus olitorius]
MADTVRVHGAANVHVNHREKLGRFLSDLHKFAVDFAVNVSRKGFTDGRKLYGILQDRFRAGPTSKLEAEKPVMEEMQLEKTVIVKNEVKQQNKTAGKESVAGPEGVKELALQNPMRNRIFIRSRL